MLKRGMVKWFSSAKGFGFITCEGRDFFAHFKNILAEGYKSLDAGDNVEFRAVEGEKGPEALDIRVIYYDGNCKDPKDCDGNVAQG